MSKTHSKVRILTIRAICRISELREKFATSSQGERFNRNFHKNKKNSRLHFSLENYNFLGAVAGKGEDSPIITTAENVSHYSQFKL